MHFTVAEIATASETHTKEIVLSNYAKSRFSRDSSALVMIDHQAGIMQLVHDYSPAEFRANVLALAEIGKVFDLPAVITSSFEQGPNGPIIQEVLDRLPNAPVVRRPGQISAWDNEDFVTAVKATRKKDLIMAGVTVDVCLAYPAMQAAADGFNVYAVIDASGAYDVASREMTIPRLVAHGITPVSWVMVAAELQRDWRNPTAAGMGQLFHDRLLNYGMLMDNFAAHSAAKEK